MGFTNDRHVIDLKGNVVRVNFRREPDPPAPKFPGANGLRPLKEEEREPECTAPLTGPAMPVLRRPFRGAIAVA
jgi:hypothetical protein